MVESRTPRANKEAELKENKRVPRPAGGDARTRTVSFTITPLIDDALHEIAVGENVSRSHVFRQAVIRYYADWKASQCG